MDDLLIYMEHMNASIEAFYRAVHLVDKIMSNKFDSFYTFDSSL
jgi:hypothetical protein